MITVYVSVPVQFSVCNTVETPLKETPNKGQDSEHQNVISYSANTFITSEERKLLYNEQNNLSQKLRYSEVPLYIVKLKVHYLYFRLQCNTVQLAVH